MTSYMIDEVAQKALSSQWAGDDSCAFCRIIAGKLSAFRVFESDLVIAILDILPLRPGHTLVIPKQHHPRLSDLPVEYSRAVGEALTIVARAVSLGTDNPDLNVVCNQGYAQAVPHVHFHIIPAPRLGDSSPAQSSSSYAGPLPHADMLQGEFHRRQELDDQEAAVLCSKIKSKL